MDVRYINPFIKSICNTFETMCRLKINVGKPQLKMHDGPITDVSGVIGISGDAAGCVVLHFDFDVASKVATQFAGTEITQDHADFSDAIGELANMVAGGAKAQFEGLSVSISLPNVIVGKNHNVAGPRTTPRLMIPCSTAIGEFHVEVGLVVTKNLKANALQTTVGASA